jgi:hypothetical protein
MNECPLVKGDHPVLVWIGEALAKPVLRLMRKGKQ